MSLLVLFLSLTSLTGVWAPSASSVSAALCGRDCCQCSWTQNGWVWGASSPCHELARPTHLSACLPACGLPASTSALPPLALLKPPSGSRSPPSQPLPVAACCTLQVAAALLGLRIGEAAHPGPAHAMPSRVEAVVSLSSSVSAPPAPNQTRANAAVLAGLDDSDASAEPCDEEWLEDGTTMHAPPEMDLDRAVGSSQDGQALASPCSAPPCHRADQGLDGFQLRTWQRAESQLGHPLASKQHSTGRRSTSGPPLGEGAFLAATKFCGEKTGFCFGSGDQGIGYYLDAVALGPQQPGGTSAPSDVPATPIMLANVLPLGGSTRSTPNEEQRSRRSRRVRKDTGSRQRWKRRTPGARHADVEVVMRDGGVQPQTSLADLWWKPLGLWAFDTTNSNCWQSGATAVLSRSSADCVLMQETKKCIPPDDPSLICRAGRRLGWSASASSARSTAAGRASGGVAILARRGIGIRPLDVVKVEHQYRQTFAHFNGCCRGGINCGSVWLKDMEGLSDTNMSLLSNLVASIGRLRGPWLLGGDWNMDPATLASSG